MLPFCEGEGGGRSESSSCAKPRMALSGERSSWLMLERNSDLARLAFWATAVASASWVLVFFSASSRVLRSETSASITRCAGAPPTSGLVATVSEAQKTAPSGFVMRSSHDCASVVCASRVRQR